jgi:hypothetical protein
MLVIACDIKQHIATASWIDSFHMSNKLMFCQGEINAEGIIDLRGSYEAPPDQNWGRRIIITVPFENQLQIVMYNCSPEGVEELAIQADYKRMSLT